MARLSAEGQKALNAVTVNTAYGCTSNGAVVMCGNDPISVSNDEVLKWTADTDELNESNAYSISSKIKSLLSPSFFTNAKLLLNKDRSELYFSDPKDENGTLWIYNYLLNVWYKFDGIGAKFMFLSEGKLGFVNGYSVYLFEEDLGHDVLEDGIIRPIIASYEGYPTDLASLGNKKRLLGMTLNGNLFGEGIKAEYISDGKTLASVEISSNSEHPSSFLRRLNSRRFGYVSIRLIADGDKAPRIYSTSVWAKP